jgi:hypothetical protein
VNITLRKTKGLMILKLKKKTELRKKRNALYPEAQNSNMPWKQTGSND